MAVVAQLLKCHFSCIMAVTYMYIVQWPVLYYICALQVSDDDNDDDEPIVS